MSSLGFKNLFGTPVWALQVGDEDFNRQITEEGRMFNGSGNYFDLPGECIARLKSIVLENAEAISKAYGWDGAISHIRGRQNPSRFGEINNPPHHHVNTRLVCVYYVNAGEGMGDILLHDPRGAVSWTEPVATTDSNKTKSAFHRVSPQSGMLLMFPGYLVHSVEPNMTQDVRLSIAINVYTELPFKH